jgi:hypothetical protein
MHDDGSFADESDLPPLPTTWPDFAPEAYFDDLEQIADVLAAEVPDAGPCGPLHLLGSGYFSVAVETPSGNVFRLACTADVAQRYAKEARLLPHLAPLLPLAMRRCRRPISPWAGRSMINSLHGSHCTGSSAGSMHWSCRCGVRPSRNCAHGSSGCISSACGNRQRLYASVRADSSLPWHHTRNLEASSESANR